MRHGDLLVAQTPSREIWFAGARSPRRTSAGKTVSRNPPWFLQPGWQTAPLCEARSLLMSRVLSTQHEITEWNGSAKRNCVYDTDSEGIPDALSIRLVAILRWRPR